MFYIIGRISDQKIIEKVEISSDVSLQKYKEAIAANYGGVDSDYSVFAIDKSDPALEKIYAGAEYEVVWDNSVISGVDFSVYDAKGSICFETDKTDILADGKDVCNITVKIIDAAGDDIKGNFADIRIPVQSPLCGVTKKVDLIDGNVKFEFMTDKAGAWKFPADGTRMISNFRVKNKISIEALLV
jgi:hypothetical protein